MTGDNFFGKPLLTTLARWAADLDFAAIPSPVIAAEKKSLLDTLAVAWAASEYPDIAGSAAAMAGFAKGSDSTLWAMGDKIPAPYAALSNGMLAAGLDFDSLQADSLVHADICVWPAALAMAEKQGKSGEAMLAAAVLGKEVACRLGLSADGNSGWFYTSVFGCFGAAAASAKLLDLDAQGIQNALAIVLSRAAGTQQPAREQAGTKRVQSAFAAQAGVEAAMLSRAGVNGPAGAIDGEFGLFAKYEGGSADIVLDGLGQRYLSAETSFKKFPCCACSHAAIEATLELMDFKPVTAEELDAVTVTITPYMHRLVGAHFDPSQNPTVSGQFSIRYGVAAALLRGRFGVIDISPELVQAKDVGELARRIEVDTFDNETGRLTPAEVCIRLRDGRQFRKRVDAIPGSPASPMTPGEFDAKISSCTSRGPWALSSGQSTRLKETVERLDSLDNVCTLFESVLEESKAA